MIGVITWTCCSCEDVRSSIPLAPRLPRMMASATFIAVQMFRESPPLVYNKKVHYFWHSKAQEEILDALDSIQIVTKACLDRLRSEFTNNFVSDLCVFDSYPWSVARQGPVNDYDSFCETRRKQVFHLCQVVQVGASQ